MADTQSARTHPAVQVVTQDENVDVRAWARNYVNLLCTLEGVALVPSAMAKAS